MTFNYDKAWDSAKTNPELTAFLSRYKARLETMTEADAVVILDRFIAQDTRGGLALFYAKDSSWSTIGIGAAEDVTNTAELARHATAIRDALIAFGLGAARLLVMALAVGFLP